jgi:hypothetical protein
MRGVPSNPLRPLDRQLTLLELDASNHHVPLVSLSMLGRLSLRSICSQAPLALITARAPGRFRLTDA